ncbi:MAG TPA: alcohol dehydrogenase catalytic domain-containing protein [Candidatus Limnocylindrales bacterium]
MRVARLHGAGDIRVGDEPVPTPGPGEVLVRVSAVGICGSDLHWYEETSIGDAVLERPLVLGHEAAGVIASGPRAGTRVAIDPNLPCGHCDTCARGLPHLCPAVRFLGHSTTDGAMRELMAWPEARLVPIPDSIDDEAGAMLEPLGVAIHALRLAEMRPGDTVGVFGAGPIGRLLIRLALASGASAVVATDRLPHRVEAARADGATAALVDGGREIDLLREALGGRPLDTAVEIAGDDDAVRTAAALVRPGSRVVVAGIPAGDTTGIPASLLRRKGLDLRFSRRMNRVYPEAIALAARIRPGEVVTAVHPIDHADRAMAEAANRAGSKVIVRPTPGVGR